ncbi:MULTISPECIES: 2TM domain-containing protein [Methylomonas]|uniref:XRE family transcriptional regulator n=1 Tax=Methylomonas koyamae TaxID=702114 RepID=A0A177NK81_9GAMM|nr:2TM domain-containing protein [Methylomonas koyamae]OAI17823.1 XRE family transcriptional regulator [Methylomonas koyamae]
MLIQKLRLQHGWSQQQLAELSGISVRTIQRIERGQTASLESLKSLAAVFEIDFSQLNSEFDMSGALNQNISKDEILTFEHVRKLRRFYTHLIQYIVIIGALAILNLLQTPRHLWVIWPALGWSVGLLIHASSVFDILPFFGAEWERKQVEKRLGRPL